jgi:hypothetical protein
MAWRNRPMDMIERCFIVIAMTSFLVLVGASLLLAL